MVGIYSGGKDLPWVAEKLQANRHRGPDNSETRAVTPTLIMAANRLAMVDRFPRSNQPMKSQTSNSTITFNGEIYNYKELRSNLMKDGFKFLTESDTEVLLIGLENFGTSFLQEINGMYSFAFFDENRNSLIFARDHLGKKPLYIAEVDDEILWSSNLSTFSERERSENPLSLDCFLRFGYVVDPLTMYKNVNAILPGYSLEINLENREHTYKIITQKKSPKKEIFREMLSRAVEDRIYKEDLIGLSMSGGLDSTIIALICKDLGLSTRTYTAKWTDSDKSRYNEDAFSARHISDALGIEHTEVEMMTSDQLPLKMRQYVMAMEEPNNNPTGISMMDLYAKIAEDGIRLTLTGDGADELFGGYDRYKKSQLFPNFLNLKSDSWIKYSGNPIIGVASRYIAGQFNEQNYSFWATWHELFSPSEIRELTGRNRSRNDNKYFSDIATVKAEGNPSKLQNQDLGIWIGMESNRRLDRVSMFHSIEARSPFLDDRIVEFALSSRNEHKFVPKSEIFMREFPELEKLPVIRKKMGFISPIGHWLRSNPEFVADRIKLLPRIFGFNYSYLQDLAKSPQNGNFEQMKKLWALMILATWSELYLSGADFER
jgi:asparagine synthase (glutamine-hydrolysing)